MIPLEDIRAAIMSAISQREIDETVLEICKKYGGEKNVPHAVRNIVAVKRAELEGKAG